MTTNTFVAVADGYQNDYTDYLQAPMNRNGSVQQVTGSATMPVTTAAGAFVGLVPFRKGATFTIGDKSSHITDIDAGTDSTVNLGIVYKGSDEGVDDVDAFVAASTAGQTGGFLAITNPVGNTYVTTGDGWLALENEANVSETEATITFNVGVSYGL